MAKLFMIEGNCCLPDLGLNQRDKQIIISDVNCIFHAAATVRFDERLRIAAYTNVRGTKEILNLAKQIKDLRVGTTLMIVSLFLIFGPLVVCLCINGILVLSKKNH